MNRRKNNKKRIPPKRYVINDRISYPEVRIIGNDVESRVVSLNEAKKISDELNMDIVLVTPNANPPVVRICDFDKFLYQEKRKKQEAEKNQRENNKDLKEMRLTPVISTGDLETKTRKIKEFLTKGHKVKISMMFKGRMIIHKEIGEKVMLELATNLEDVGRPEALPKFQGKFLNMMVSPKK